MACSRLPKKFGGSVASADEIEMLSKISENTDYLITSSSQIEDYYREAFQIDRQKIKALGLPRLDYYFENHNLDKIKDDFAKNMISTRIRKSFFMLQLLGMMKSITMS